MAASMLSIDGSKSNGGWGPVCLEWSNLNMAWGSGGMPGTGSTGNLVVASGGGKQAGVAEFGTLRWYECQNEGSGGGRGGGCGLGTHATAAGRGGEEAGAKCLGHMCIRDWSMDG